MNNSVLESFKAALKDSDVERLRPLLEASPELANARPWEPHSSNFALDAAADGCVWHRPEKHRLCRLLVEFGAECSLQTAARAGMLDVVQAQLDSNPAMLDATDAIGRTALYRSVCVYGAFPEGDAIADFLIGRGAYVDLYSACAMGCEARVDELLTRDPSLANQRDPEGITALHWAVRPRRDPATAVCIVTKLLQAGADLHAANPQEDGMMPLHHAAEWSAPDKVIELLLHSGARVQEAAAGSGWTALEYAIDRDREAAAKLLRTYETRG